VVFIYFWTISWTTAVFQLISCYPRPRQPLMKLSLWSLNCNLTWQLTEPAIYSIFPIAHIFIFDIHNELFQSKCPFQKTIIYKFFFMVFKHLILTGYYHHINNAKSNVHLKICNKCKCLPIFLSMFNVRNSLYCFNTYVICIQLCSIYLLWLRI